MKKLSDYIYLILGGLTIVFFLFGQGVTWYAMGGDTEAYYIYFGHHIEAKPLYPFFFHLLNLLFGEGLYLYAAAVIQMIVAVFCIVLFVRFLGKRMELDNVSIVIIWIASLFPFYLLLPEDPIPHVLMTESFTYPLLYLYIVIVLKGIFDNKYQYFYFSVLFAILMTMIRGQMLFLITVSLASYFYALIKDNMKKGWKELLKKTAGKLAVFCVFMMLCVEAEGFLTAGYERLFFHAPKQDYSAQTLVQKALFCSDRENEELFSDETEREIFKRTYEGMWQMETTYEFATEDLWDWKHTTASFGADSYLVQDVIEEVLTEQGSWSKDTIEQENQVLYYSRQLTAKLMKRNILRCLKISIKMMPAGFVSTVLMHKESIYGLIHVATLFLYIAAIAGSLLISKWKGCLLKETEYMLLIVLTAVLNVVASNLIHFGLQRYLAYTVGMFYVGGYLLARQLFMMVKQGKVVNK